MLISACMIVKNEEKMLERTLPNLVKLVDEVILVDTGSTDNTIELAKKAGAKVFSFKWINDFSAARNESLKHANGDWIIWVDADEYIHEKDMNIIKSKLAGSQEIGFNIVFAECKEGGFKPLSYSARPKVFKNNIGIHFERQINEAPYDKNGIAIAVQAGQINAFIYHWGYFVNDETFLAKKERNITIFEEAVKNNSKDLAYNYLLAVNYLESKMADKAIVQFDKVIELSPNGNLAQDAMTHKASIYYKNREGRKAFTQALEALKLNNINPTAWNIVGGVFFDNGKYEKAIEAFNSAIECKDASSILINLRQIEYLANLLISKAYLKLGKTKEAYEAAKKAYNFDQTDEAKSALEEATCR